MTPVVHGLLVWALLIGGARPGGQGPEGYQDQREAAPPRVMLTNDRPSGYFPIDQQTLASAPPILVVRITSVVNPDRTPFQVFVYLSYQSRAGQSEPERILIGNFGFYPPDHPSAFLLRASTAFRKLKTTSSRPTDVRLLLEMRRIHEAKPWTPVEVTVAPPEWRDQ
ncbi:MAG TPA: hypothetical protein VKM93_15350 [Terriglobia bacterium]|nr:hypothetical protein [Terriglobia bacterium]